MADLLKIDDRLRRAIFGLADIAELLGVVKDLIDELTRRNGILPGATEPPRLGERRNDEWRGQVEGAQEKDPGCSDLINKDDDSESEYWTRRAEAGWRALKQRPKQKRRQRHTGEQSREE